MVLELAAVGSLDSVMAGVVRAWGNLVEENRPVWHQKHLHAIDAAPVWFGVQGV